MTPHPCNDVNEFLAALYPPNCDYRYFRGVGRYPCKLLPSLYRHDLIALRNEYPSLAGKLMRYFSEIEGNQGTSHDLKAHFGREVDKDLIDYHFHDFESRDRLEYRLLEMLPVFDFYKAATGIGISIPMDCHDLSRLANKSIPDLIFDGDVFDWPQHYTLPLIALAQHYRLPTCFLDWTYNPYIAAFFAAKSCLENPTTDLTAVFASNILEVSFDHKSEVKSTKRYNPPSLGNANAKSQSSTLTYTVFSNKYVRMYLPEISEIREGLDVDLDFHPHPEENLQLKVFTLPSSLAKDLLTILHTKFQLNDSTIFPDLQGAIDFVKNQKLYY